MEEELMPARVIQNQGKKQGGAAKVQIKTPTAQEETPNVQDVQEEMKMTLSQGSQKLSSEDRASFYAGHERIALQGNSVQRVRELQEENDHLQREISAKEEQISECTDPLAILAEVEHRKVIIARNTGEILKIYTRNEERIKRIKELESHNARIQNELSEMQGRFISTKDLEEKTKFASEFFILKSEIERNLNEINILNQK